MMNTLLRLKLFFLAMTILFAGCIANTSPANRRNKISANVNNTNTPTTPTTPVFQSDELIYWYSAEKVLATITLNLNNENVIYLRGQNIHNFLSSKNASNEDYFRKQYCLVGNYGTNKQLRVRAVPIYINNFTTKAMERLLRIDVPNRTENNGACGIASIGTVAPAAAAYALNEICPSCAASGYLTSVSLALYESKIITSTLLPVESSKLSLAGMGLRVDLTNNSTTPVSSCSNSACEAKGFDCCIEGQCVKDASLKASASTDPLYAQAVADYAKNPLSFINYPNIYNICSNINHTPPPVTNPGTTPVSEAQARVDKYFEDFSCINKHESNIGSSTCTSAQYLTAKKTLAIACGCPATYTDAEREVKCPNWGVRPLYPPQTIVQDPTVKTNIVDFLCYTPLPESPVGPITNLNVSVPSRSAPHRFYATDGKSYDEIGKLASTITQEGDDFYYLDSLTKTGPVNGPFNINSILGRMKIDLSQTQPAKMVSVELGKTYILSATTGYFTPCSQCAKDSWFQSFSAHPATPGGSGLKAINFTTSRDTYSGNTSFGNYEDTKFGRACYVPATMLAFSHLKKTDLQTQRQSRLRTQAALYANGYQRDWYGFNKGALIGSFDGVSWFAIGTARRITASSTKLYLAINGAFLDLADKTDTIVNIIPDQGGNTAADYDFDPQTAINSVRQNSAGSCQQYHQCSTDSDCVTKLGWEYSCIDVSQLRTKWPVFDSDAKELVNQERSGTIFEILQLTTNMGDSPKRCVYRGAGAPCVRDLTAISDNFNRKALTCAPNFYCAGLETSKFNDEVVRSPNEIGNVLYGMDANVLGRPLNYVTGSKALTADIVANIKNSSTPDALNLTAAQAGDMGICRPGKQLSTNESTAHSGPDTSRRTDFISQVGTCDSTSTGGAVTTNMRFLTCPVFGDDLNYVDPTASNLTTLSVQQAKRSQNACGGEAKDSSNNSAFSSIEALSLMLSPSVINPTLVRDACFRRAGSVCHTDLDCGPNKMHEEVAGTMDLKYFGGTEAEQNYWKESLICGQGTPVPPIGSADYFTYNMGSNRCCREIGKDFTMYTSGPLSIIKDNGTSNASLNTRSFAVTNPNANNRYSRYTVSPTAALSSSKIPRIVATAEPAAEQWKVINETGSLNCCGGGWIRKFADGTHDWKVKGRLTFEASNLSCLNFRSPLVDPDYNGFGDAVDKIVLSSYQQEFENFCRNHLFGEGCFQVSWQDGSNFQLKAPYRYIPRSNYYLADGDLPQTETDDHARLDTTPIKDPIETGQLIQNNSPDAPYQPEPFYFPTTPRYDVEPDTKKAYNFFTSKTIDYGVSMYLPAYIPYNAATTTASIGKVWIKYYYDDNPNFEAVEVTAVATAADCTATIDFNAPTGQPVDRMSVLDGEMYCVTHSAKTGNRPVINVKAYTGADPARQWKYAGVVIEFIPLEISKSTKVTVPGSSWYYLTKLGRLELNGIPQITYEPLFCNNNHNRLVPGIFTSTIQTRSQFETSSVAYSSIDPIESYEDLVNQDVTIGYGNAFDIDPTAAVTAGPKFTYQDKLELAPIFSSKDFTCCTQLGKETSSAAKCCSGAARTVGSKQYCMLPSGTNLNVYFNKFVSSEGVGADQPGGEGLIVSDPLDDTKVDFNAYTGEPKLRQSTIEKLQLLGEAYCEKKSVTDGAAFGKFPPEPFAGSYNIPPDGLPGGSLEGSFPYSIVDSIVDFEKDDTTKGKFPFDAGFRWNHHIYCK